MFCLKIRMVVIANKVSASREKGSLTPVCSQNPHSVHKPSYVYWQCCARSIISGSIEVAY